ncbi:MAG: MBOAT family protein [Roseburia sp.]|nr:MBOAT family protein [Roseburia sp.]
MQFTSFEFAVFFPIVVLLFYIMPKRLRTLWLLVASYYFYMGWNARYAALIFVSTLVTYLCARILGRVGVSDEPRNRQKRAGVLAAGLVINLGLLVFFKYFYFLYDTAARLALVFGLEIGEPRLDILLPVGISFYTFQAVGYMIDVYRGTVLPEKSFVRYALFVSFFPQLVAGPIERSGRLLGQLEAISHKRMWDFDRVTRGLLLMLWGFFMKLVIADRAAVLVNQVFAIYYMFNGVALSLAAFLFAIQIYCDFASYSVIAMGAARVLGIELMANFEAPFFSRSVSELWRRWHISLSSWLRDYVYIPLGGNRCPRLRRYWNTMVTFLVSGLWHGASWHFVFWGGLQGVFIIIGDMLRPVKKNLTDRFRIRVNTFGYAFFQGVSTFFLFLFSLVFFRADTIRDGLYYLQRMVTHFDVWSLFDESVYYLGLDKKEMGVLWAGILILLLVDMYYARKRAFIDTLVKEQCLAVQYVIVLALLVMIVVFGVYGEGYDATQFIYFQF